MECPDGELMAEPPSDQRGTSRRNVTGREGFRENKGRCQERLQAWRECGWKAAGEAGAGASQWRVPGRVGVTLAAASPAPAVSRDVSVPFSSSRLCRPCCDSPGFSPPAQAWVPSPGNTTQEDAEIPRRTRRRTDRIATSKGRDPREASGAGRKCKVNGGARPKGHRKCGFYFGGHFRDWWLFPGSRTLAPAPAWDLPPRRDVCQARACSAPCCPNSE